ncbi:MAG: tetratricopeptide repeat protein [Parvularculaceae bacterium]
MSSALLALAATALTACAGAPRDDTLTGEYLTGRFAARSNALDAAASAYADASAAAPGVASISGRAFAYQLASGDIPKAAMFAGRILAVSDDNQNGGLGLAHLTVAARSMKAGGYARAKGELAHGVSPGYLEPVAYMIGVWADAGLNGPEAGLERLGNPDTDFIRAFAPLHRALLAEQAGRFDDARDAHQASVMSPLGGIEARIAFGAFLERSGDVPAAREFYALMAQEPGPARRAAEAGLKRLDAGRQSRAYSKTTPVEGGALAFYALGEALLQQMALQHAAAARAGFSPQDASFVLPLSLAQIALYLDPSLDAARRRIASIYNLYGDYERAIEILDGVTPASPHYEQARVEQASALATLGAEDEAIKLLKKTARQDKEAAEARLALAGLLAAQDRHEDAVKVLTGVISGLDDNPEEDAWRFFVARGASLLELDRWPEAEADLKRAVEIAPEEETALNYLGYSWAERGVNLEKAFDLIEKAVSLRPGSGAITDSLGWAHYQLGNYEEAVIQLERAAAMEPADPTITDHLGDVYWRLGRKLEARYQWMRALELDPGEKLRAAIEMKLAKGLPDADQ